MDYEIKKSSGNYLGRNSGIFNRFVLGLTGLALLVNGCIGKINGVDITSNGNNEKPTYVGYNGEPLESPEQKEDKKEEEKWYTNPWVIGGIVVGGAAIGTGTYFLVDELTKKKRDEEERFVFGGGERDGGPGGQ